jgi:hypothetical protein
MRIVRTTPDLAIAIEDNPPSKYFKFGLTVLGCETRIVLMTKDELLLLASALNEFAAETVE